MISLNSKAQTDDVFTIYLVRHSEKDYSSKNSLDLPLSKCGEQRSHDLSNFLNNIHLDAVYCTDYKRTRDTALPTAIAKNIDVTLYDNNNLNSFSKNLFVNSDHYKLLYFPYHPTRILLFLKRNFSL